VLAAPLLWGCADDTAGAGSADAAVAFQGADGAARLAVIGSDFKTSSVSLIDLATGHVSANFLNSGSKVSAVSIALSGDVVLAQNAAADGRIVIIDRTNAVLTFVDPATLQVSMQISVATGFLGSNPQDFLQLSPTRGLVTRMGANPKPTADAHDFDDGDDVVVIDLQTKKVVARVALTPFATKAAVLAAPGRMAFDGEIVWLPLASLKNDFTDAGSGRVLGLDPQTLQIVRTVQAEGSKNCTRAAWLPQTGTVAVVCQGFFGDGADQVKGSNLVTFDASAGQPLAVVAIAAQSLGNSTQKGPLSGDFAFVDGRHGVLISAGDFKAGTHDAAWQVDLETGSATQIALAGGPFAFTGMASDALRGRIYLGERLHVGGDIRVFDLAGGATATELPAIAANQGGLGATDLGRF
jgi:hypothetical protein